MADTTVRNDCFSAAKTVYPDVEYYDLTFGADGPAGVGNGLSPLRWVMFSNPSASESVTINFVGDAGGGLLLGPEESSPVLPGRWFGFSAIADGIGDFGLHILGGY